LVSAIDTSTDLWKRVLQRSAADAIIWLTTTAADGTPQPNPVWFIDDGDDLVIYSKPNQAKLTNIGRNPHISCHLQSDIYGDDVQILTGTARIVDPATISTETLDRYMAKYAEGIASLGSTPEKFAAAYSVGIRFTPGKLRGWT